MKTYTMTVAASHLTTSDEGKPIGLLALLGFDSKKRVVTNTGLRFDLADQYDVQRLDHLTHMQSRCAGCFDQFANMKVNFKVIAEPEITEDVSAPILHLNPFAIGIEDMLLLVKGDDTEVYSVQKICNKLGISADEIEEEG